MKCIVIRAGSHGLVGDRLDYVGELESMPASIVPLEEVESLPEVAALSQSATAPAPPVSDVTPIKLRTKVLLQAAETLDAKDDVNWTESGQVSMGPLNTELQNVGQLASTRAEFRNLLPNFTRPELEDDDG